ncbi:MAG: MotE family protein [Planctomycetota bacterium]
MKKLLKGLFAALSLVGALVLVTGLVLAAVFYFSGAITRGKVDDIVKVVQGELTSPPAEEVAEEVQPTPRTIQSEEELKKAVTRFETQTVVREESFRLQKEAIESMLRELSTVTAALDKRATEISQREAAFEAARAAQGAAERDEGFKAAVAVYQKMDAKDVAGSLYGLTDEEIVRYLRAFKTSFSAEVLAKMKRLDEEKNPGQELNRAARLLEMFHGEQIALARERPPAGSQ